MAEYIISDEQIAENRRLKGRKLFVLPVVVRCRDCRFARPEPKSDIKSRKPYQGGYWCDELSEGIGLFCDPDCFCSWGERKRHSRLQTTKLGSGECKIIRSATDGLCSDNQKVYYDLSCGHRMMLYGLDVPIRCAVCGKAVKR